MNTKGYLNHLLDYDAVFGKPGGLQTAVDLIKGIPSVTLLTRIGIINLQLYLADSGEQGQQVQNAIIKTFFQSQSSLFEGVIKAYKLSIEAGAWPMVFYRYSNLLFYEMIFQNFTEEPFRELTSVDLEKIFESYLAVNSVVNRRTKIDEQAMASAIDNDEVELILLPQFIYQRDYTSNVDYTNQTTRAFYFFKYLEEAAEFKDYIEEYYLQIGVTNSIDLIAKIGYTINTLIKDPPLQRNPVLTLMGDILENHNFFFLKLAIDKVNSQYLADNSFTALRNQMLFLLPNKKFLLLDIGFMIDYLYKAHVFGINKFLKGKGIKKFLETKAEHFSERIYLDVVLRKCFPLETLLPGHSLLRKEMRPLIDYVIKAEQRILLIEFKDTLLSSIAKDGANNKLLFDRLDEKFLANEKDAPKGIRQLFHAVEYLDLHFDTLPVLAISASTTIYPVIVYTDNTFGYDGINRLYKRKFNQLLGSRDKNQLQVRDVTFINLSLFEVFENYFRKKNLTIFDLIDQYHLHVQSEEHHLTPFEVFAASFRKEYVKEDLGLSSLYLETIEEVKHLING